MERKAISQRKCKKTIPWADALILVGVQWSKRLVVDGRLSQEVLTCLPAGERGKECLWEFLGHHIPGPEKGARCGPGGRGKHVSATSPPSSPRFQQSKLAPTAASFYPERPPIWRELVAPTAASFYPERPPIWRELVLDCQGQLTVPVTLPNWKRIRVRFFFSFISLAWFETCVDKECGRLGCNRNARQQMTVFMARMLPPTTAISIRWGPGSVCLSLSISCCYLTLQSPSLAWSHHPVLSVAEA